MPFINTKTNVQIPAEKETVLKEKFGKAISLIRGKSEAWLMLNFQDNCHMYFKGDGEAPCAMIEVKLYGSASPQEYEALTNNLTKIISCELNIPELRIYIKYEETAYWGWGGHNF